jgi:hypothetical protein
MTGALKLVLSAVAAFVLGWALVALTTIVAAGAAGPTVRGGERAVTFLAFFDVAVGLIGATVVALLAWRWVSGITRWLVPIGFLAAWAVGLVVVFGVTVVLFNR